MKNRWYDNAVMINRDPCWSWLGAEYNSAEECRKFYEDYFSIYDGAATDILLGVFEQTALTPNPYITWRGEKYDWKTEGGIPVDYKNCEQVYKIYNCYNVYNVDPVQIFIEQINKLDKRPWFTFRMNDGHGHHDGETSWLRSSMYYEEEAAGHTLGEKYTYLSKHFNFKYRRYRTAVLDYIIQMISKYDVFGVELDFMRNPCCVDHRGDPECHKIMLDYMREVKKRVSEVEKMWGHSIKISIRTFRSPVDALILGYDVKTMVDEGLVDVVVPTPWFTADSNLLIADWRQHLGDNVAIMGGLEAANVREMGEAPKYSKAYAAAFYAEGADGIYYNNHEYGYDWQKEAWKINRDSCYKGLREFVVTHQDWTAIDGRKYWPLPLKVESEGELPLKVGKVKVTDVVKVLVEISEGEVPTLEICGREYAGEDATALIKNAPRTTEGKLPKLENAYIYDISGISTESRITLTFNGDCAVSYVNMIIDAK